jgi:tetratricopeptide (TPR) repeat protein
MSILEYDEAVEIVEQALELAPDDPGLLALRTEQLRLAGQVSDGMEHRQNEARGYLELAVRSAREGSPGRALVLLEEAMIVHPTSLEIRRRLADLYLFYGMAGESEKLYRAVLNAAPADDNASRGLQASVALGRAPSF